MRFVEIISPPRRVSNRPLCDAIFECFRLIPHQIFQIKFPIAVLINRIDNRRFGSGKQFRSRFATVSYRTKYIFLLFHSAYLFF